MKSRGLVERNLLLAGRQREGKRRRGRIRIVLLVGTAVFMLWSSPTTAAPSLPASPMFVIGPITLPLVNNSANGVVFGGQATGTGGFGVIGFASATSSQNFGVAGAANSSTGTGVFGLALATSCPNVQPGSPGQTCVGVVGQSRATSGGTAGVFGLTQSPSGLGVFGLSTATSGANVGVLGQTSSPDGRGVFGFSTATSGNNYGVLGQTNSTVGAGVFGIAQATSGNNSGVFGQSFSPDGRGVTGFAPAASGVNSGVFGQSFSPDGHGITGLAVATSGNNSGVLGQTNSTTGTGVLGLASATNCPTVFPPINPGQSCVGVFGQSPIIGVVGQSSATSPGTGVVATGFQGVVATGFYGVQGTGDSSAGFGVSGTGFTGVLGFSGGGAGTGVLGEGFNGVRGVSGSSGGAGVRGEGTLGALAGRFVGSVNITGNLSVSGTKSALVDTVSYGKRQLYAVESPESWFEDFGSAKLDKGHAIVPLDPIFAQTVNTEDEYHIFLTPKGECKGLYVANQRATSFEVKELQNGKSSIAFDYRIAAKRKGYERARLPAPTR